MVVGGKKHIEYRECSDYWISRLVERYYSRIVFVNGYNKASPRFEVFYCGYKLYGYYSLPDYVKEYFKDSKYKLFFDISFL